MTPGSLDAAVIRRHLLAIDEALQILRRHQGRPVGALSENAEERWIVERGLQLCAQNALDIATHLAASSGHEVTDYAAAIDRLAELEVLPRPFASRARAFDASGRSRASSARRRAESGAWNWAAFGSRRSGRECATALGG